MKIQTLNQRYGVMSTYGSGGIGKTSHFIVIDGDFITENKI